MFNQSFHVSNSSTDQVLVSFSNHFERLHLLITMYGKENITFIRIVVIGIIIISKRIQLANIDEQTAHHTSMVGTYFDHRYRDFHC